jgi:hypothetical protein
VEEKQQSENRIFQQKCVLDSNSSSFLEILYTVKDCIQKDMNTKQWKQVSLLDLWKDSE